ncbi:DUF1294 domain-containing protein [Devosia psychrophila]|uniref:Uncharacterized membrane protein YsdA, DUF1294 family n=1 Tax=Devosia psychrophila TaxID=728005 RepID=A0A0F5PS98_9HYPH|nr:DUF1294 domain-containing protein [Devosia psychrophila]KKC31542.1 hypothetical protein WH91_19130 [Devosia psychrophila]SFB97131.1 Uncharacterized membrane protein YsdA, DUF1294 family [Devosia psychrophila]
MSRSGELVQWNNKGGYGFVRDEAGRDYYVHISSMTNGDRPKLGDKLSFETGKGRNARPAAIEVVITETTPAPVQTLRESMRPSRSVSRYKLGLRTAAATLMTLLILWAIGTERAPVWIGLLYAAMGAASALLYRFDKLYAMKGEYRVSENNLHYVDLCFGIIGGLAAQEVYRHKTVKPSFVTGTWAITLVHTLGLAALAFGLLHDAFGGVLG